MAKVLVVDDHSTNRDLLVTLLKHAGHGSIEAADGKAALEQVRAERPDLVICDILMPTMDGYEFVRQLRADPLIAQTEVIFYTATFMEHEARRLANSCGVSNVLTKPCEPEEILRIVELALGQAPVEAPAPIESEFDREHLRLLSDKLTLKVNELESANLRLSALTDLNLQLASERDPGALLDKVCRGARDLLGARYAVLGVRETNGGESIRLCTWGVPDAQAKRLRDLPSIDAGLLGEVMSGRHARRFASTSDGSPSARLPADFPPARSGLIVPIISLHRSYGWIALLDKLGSDAFTEEDEHVLAICGAQAGRIYENGSLYNETRRAAEQLRVANETLEHRVKLRTAELREIIEGLESFNRSISHDLRGPLGGIADAARMALDFIADSDYAKANRFMQEIATQADISARLVEALLALARTSDVSMDKQRLDMDALVREVIEALQRGRSTGVQLPVSMEGRLGEVDADPELARQVLVNLIGNALKFTATVAQPQVEVGMTGGPYGPVFFVRDNGVGFDAEKAHRLFKPFSRLHSFPFEGSGVGLSIVKRIIDRHGGEIWAESATGRGATFYFSFGEVMPAQGTR